tara:strand:- start:1000 stop:2325 length:1326 start_codon:yes stop_codon:yes gene_type:complete
MDKFFEYKQDKEYKYKILVYPNITYMKDLEKDSYVVVLKNVIEETNKVRDDIHWTILSPKHIMSLQFENTEQLMIKMPSYPNKMRTHFDADEILKVIDWRNEDYDVIYSHLPEQTLALSNLLKNSTNINPEIVGYSHWFEVKENSNYDPTMLAQNLLGVLEMKECGVNSIWLKDFVIDKSKEILNDKQVGKLEKIIQPHYLGIDDVSPDNEYEPNTILFNHRDNDYTGYSWFVEQMDELYKERQDFKVFTTLTNLDRPYAERVKLSSRKEYLNFVRKMHMGVGCFKTYSAWSISTTDGLSQGVPYVLPNKLCYPEMVGKDYPLLYNEEDFLSTIKNMLDNPKAREEANTYLRPMLPDFKWDGRVAKWFTNWSFLNDLKTMGNTEGYQKVLDYVNTAHSTSKSKITKKFGWGVRVKWTPYRNRLRNEKNIRFTKNRYEVIKK